MNDTLDVQVGKALIPYLQETFPEFTIRRGYEDVRDLLDEETLATPEAVLVLEGMEDTTISQRGVQMDLRFTLGLFAPIQGETESKITEGMDACMEFNYRMQNAFFQKNLTSETLGNIKLVEVLRTGGAMFDSDLFRLYHLFGNEYSLVVRYFREVPR